jgi:hypothetical protein
MSIRAGDIVAGFGSAGEHLMSKRCLTSLLKLDVLNGPRASSESA